jgi:glucose/arabinose dehydrogenase
MHGTKKVKAKLRAPRKLHVETLESRVLLAGDTYLVNFQLAGAPTPARYLVDSGQIYGARPSGLFYGWSTDHTDQSRDRGANPDQRLDTLIHFELNQKWEFGLPNGTYEVTASIGDPSNASTHTLNVEGVNYWDAAPLTANNFLQKTMTVTVSDGRLTLDQGSALDKATRINFVHIVNVPSSPNGAPVAPTITEPATEGQVVSPADVHMESTGYSDPDGNAHKSTDWEIWTVGPGAQPVWQTLGIEGIEKEHTHFGDGVFINSRAGQISLAANTDHQLRVRYRDVVGSVSAYAVRNFHTGAASAAFPLELEDVAASPTPVWQDTFGSTVELPGPTFIIPIDADGFSSSPDNEQAMNALDGTLAKYLNFGRENSGFIITPSGTPTVVTQFRITTADDFSQRDPASYQLYGTNDAILSTEHSDGTGETWTLIASGSLSLPNVRNTLGPIVSFANSTAYTSYKMLFPTVKDAGGANSMQIAEINFFLGPSSATPGTLRLEGTMPAQHLLTITGVDAAGNATTNPPALADHARVRVVIQAGSAPINVGQSNLSFIDDHDGQHVIYLPAISLPAGQRLDLWVTEDGSTYYGTALQSEPDFSMLARASEDVLNNPFVVLQPGYVVEQVGGDYRLPVNIAFVPNPGPNPTDPLYYVTELYGSIQVVRRDGTKLQFATGLLDYNPQGPFGGTGEQGLTGIAVQRDEANPDIYHLYVGMLWDNGAPPGGLVHYPKVERITSASGGLTMASRTVLLNMQPETQGQSHQISNITIGPDGKLYVHNGDGFTTSTAQNLNSYRGKILRMNLDGTAPSDNPFYNGGTPDPRDYIFAYGVRNPFGGAWRASDDKHYSVENGPSVDRLAQINRNVNYGWNGSDASMTINAIYNWNPAHAPVNMAFIQPETFGGSNFPNSKFDHLFVSESGPTYATGPQGNGKRIVEFVLDDNGNRMSGPTTLVEYRGTGQGSVVGLAAGPDGLYFTELYEDSGNFGPTASGARIFRVRYVGQPTGDYDYNNQVDGGDFLAWQRSLGSATNLRADGDRSLLVGGGDLEVWQANFGLAPVVTAAVAAEQSVASAALLTATDESSLAGLATAGTPGSGAANGLDKRALSRPEWRPPIQHVRTDARDAAFRTGLYDLEGGSVSTDSLEQREDGSSDVDDALSLANNWLVWDRL